MTEEADPGPPTGTGTGTGGGSGGSVPGAGVNVLLVMSLETMRGLRDDPAYLDKYGPVAADLARDLAADGTFRCAAADDQHGTILGLGKGTYTDRYRPGRRLADLTRATWRHCSWPGCRNRAHGPGRCDLDHNDPWPHGATCSCNLSPLCRRHHRLKTHLGIVLEPSKDPHDPPGTLRWHLPSGRTYPTRPRPMTIDRSALTTAPGPRPGQGPEPPGPTTPPERQPQAPTDDPPPPF